MVYYVKSDIVPGLAYTVETKIPAMLTFSQWLYHLRRKQEVEKHFVYFDFNIMPSQEGKSIWYRHSQSGVIKFVCSQC